MLPTQREEVSASDRFKFQKRAIDVEFPVETLHGAAKDLAVGCANEMDMSVGTFLSLLMVVSGYVSVP